jgi:phosphatidylinositol glycan class S
MWILASFYTAIVIAIPFWLKATTIERLPLPRHEVVAWEAQLPCPIRMQQSITLHLSEDVIKQEDRFAVADRIQWALRVAGDGIWEQRRPRKHYVDDEADQDEEAAEVEPEEKAAMPLQYAACVDWEVRVADLDEHRTVNELREYNETPDRHFDSSLIKIVKDYDFEFLQKHEEASPMNSTTTARRISIPLPAQLSPDHNLNSEDSSFILSSYLARLLQLPYTSLLLPFNNSSSDIGESPLTSPKAHDILAEIEVLEEDRRRVPYTRNLRLVFSLINEEISASSGSNPDDRKQISGVKGWDRTEVNILFHKRFSSLLKALGETQTVFTELQTTWFAPLQFQPKILEIEREPEVPLAEEQPKVAAEEEEDEGKAAEKQEEGEVEGLKDLEVQESEAILVPPPAKIVDQYHLIDWEDIKVFVNSGEWSLTSGAVTLPLTSVNTSSADVKPEQDLDGLFEQSERTLHFIVYIPKPSHRPLRIAGNQEATILSEAKGWLIPQWGGVSLYNLGYEEVETSRSFNSPLLDYLSASELDSAFATFEKQFSTLLGLQDLQGSIPIAYDAKLALQLDAMTRRRLVASSRESVKTLGSIIRLVDKIENLGVGQSVRNDISKALALLQKVSSIYFVAVSCAYVCICLGQGSDECYRPRYQQRLF